MDDESTSKTSKPSRRTQHSRAAQRKKRRKQENAERRGDSAQTPASSTSYEEPEPQSDDDSSFDSFDYGSEDTNNDRISLEWTNAPEGAAKQFRREWFQGDGMVRRKNLPIEYNS